MTLAVASFVIAVISALISCTALMLGNEHNKLTRYVIGTTFILITVVFSSVAFFSLFGEKSSTAQTNAQVMFDSAPSTSSVRIMSQADIGRSGLGEPQPVITTPPKQRQAAPTEPTALPPEAASASHDGWLICWHGGWGYEYLVAYPAEQAQQGVNLDASLVRPWDGKTTAVENDSLKMCLLGVSWYGEPQRANFPFTSYLRLGQGQIQVCEDAPGCHGRQWSLSPTGNPPAEILSLLRQPTGGTAQVLGYEPSEQVPGRDRLPGQ